MRIGNTEVEKGGILVVVVVMCGIVGATLMAYLGMVSSQEKFVHRSAVWNSCIIMCESGVEEALAHINHRNTASNFAINGWSPVSGGFYKERYLNKGKCDITISSTSYPPIITATAKLPAPLNHGEVKRTVRVNTRVSRVFPHALLSKTRLILGGSGQVDSFNSTNKLESTNGQYSAALATDRAVVASLTRNTSDFNVQNVDIHGFVATGPGVIPDVGPNGVVGSRNYALDPKNASTIETGHWRNDFNMYIPEPALAPNFSVLPTLLAPGSFNGTNYAYVAHSGDYYANKLTVGIGEVFLVTGEARIHVLGDVTITGTILLMTNATLEWYQSGSSLSVGGKGVVNSRGFAKDFSVIGLSTCKSVSYSGSVQFIGTVYAPSATVVLEGSANAYGAVVGNSIEMKGTMSMHYDEALNEPQKARFVAESWAEIRL